MESSLLPSLAAILVLGIGAQWMAWRLRLPAILFLLLMGLFAGPVTGLIRPDELFGDLLFPVVSLSVGLILFEGGLSLRLDQLRLIGKPVRNLVLIGSLVSWVITAFAARLFLGFDTALALLLGAILVVTGPTVIIPLLRQVKPKEPIGSILRWEGILIDPFGATLALLVFEAMHSAGPAGAALPIALAMLRTLFFGTLLGLAGGYVLAELIGRYWVPDYLQNPISIMFVIFTFTISNTFQHESGLLAVTVMGVYLANQRRAEIGHIVEFKETLQVLLIAMLFVTLSARLSFEDMFELPLQSLMFLAAVIVVARPASVFVSTWRTDLTLRDKIFLACMAPRGIVAASVASVFALRLTEEGYGRAHLVAPATFLVIIGTVAVYGLSAGIIARRLDVAQPNPTGLAFLGGQAWARALGVALQKAGVTVLIADTNRANILAARMVGLRTYYGNILSDFGTEQADLTGIGGFLALTPNSDTNSLACKHFESLFGRSRVYELVPFERGGKADLLRPRHLRGRSLFGEGVTFATLAQRFAQGAEFKSTPLTAEFTFDSFREHYGKSAVPLMVIGSNGVPEPLATDESPNPAPGHILVSLASPESAGETSDPL